LRLAAFPETDETSRREQHPDPHHRHCFPTEIIGRAVALYHVFVLSLRDVELLLAVRGVVVSYETVRAVRAFWRHYKTYARGTLSYGTNRLPVSYGATTVSDVAEFGNSEVVM
jgi:hypothetical protein